MYDNNIEMTVLIKGRPITEYQHRGKIYVEGRGGSEYELRVRNKTGGRIEAVISVDGRSITDGKVAGPESGGYMLKAYETITIPGWLVDAQTQAKFAFAGKQDSYSTEMSGGDATNNGVIGIMVFSEKYQPPVYTPSPIYHPLTYPGLLGGSIHNTVDCNNIGYNGAVGSGSVQYSSSNVMHNSNTKYGMSASLSASASAASSPTKSFKSKSISRGIAPSGDSYYEENSLRDTEIQSLGTAFGEATTFHTKTVEFKRGDMISLQIIRYDDARGLKARGVVITRPSKQKYQTQPEAFPAMQPQGCVPPDGWCK